MGRPAKGVEFTHDRVLDPTWEPTKGQKWADAPKARMVITRTAEGTVWFGYAGTTKSHTYMDLDDFMARFGSQMP